MALPAIVDDLDAIPESARDFYAAGDDGRFYLQIDGAENLPSVTPLKNALEKQKAKGEELKNQNVALRVGCPEDFSAEEWERLKAVDAAVNAKAAAELDEFQRETREKIAALDRTINKQRAFVCKLLIDSALRRELINVGVMPQLLPACIAMFAKDCKVLWRQDGFPRGHGNVDHTNERGFRQPVKRAVARWASLEGRAFLRHQPAAPQLGGFTAAIRDLR
jgi:hypothetical protein